VAASLIFALAATSAGAAGKRSTATLTGAGSSLIGPAVAVWSQLYKPDTINYAAIGSGGGIAQSSARNVDFAASDDPLTKGQGAGCHSCVQLPWALTATSPCVNIPGLPADQLH